MGNVKKTSDVITEKPLIIRFGLLFFILRPMTMAQMYEIGALVEKTEEMELEGEFNPIVKMLQSYKEIAICSKVATLMLFRSLWMRKIFGWYVRHLMTMDKYQKIVEYSAITFRAAFFLTSFSFLKGIKETTKTTNTVGATTLGGSSED